MNFIGLLKIVSLLWSLVISDCCIADMHLLPYKHWLTLLFAQQQKASDCDVLQQANSLNYLGIRHPSSLRADNFNKFQYCSEATFDLNSESQKTR